MHALAVLASHLATLRHAAAPALAAVRERPWAEAAGAALALYLWARGSLLATLTVRVLFGAAALMAVNLLGRRLGLEVGVNPLAALVVGWLGWPGLAALVIGRALLG